MKNYLTFLFYGLNIFREDDNKNEYLNIKIKKNRICLFYFLVFFISVKHIRF